MPICFQAYNRLQKNFGLFLALWYGASIAFVYMFPSWGIKMTAYHFLLAGIECLACLLILSLLPKILHSIVSVILLAFSGINLIVDYIVIKTTGDVFHMDIVALVMGTNVSEGTEFFESYFSPAIVLTIIVLEGIFILLCIFAKKHRFQPFIRVVSIVGILSILFVSIFTNILKSETWGVVFLGKAITISQYQSPPDISKYHSIPNVTLRDDGDSVPHNIVVIIGESFSRSHSSLYGYNKETNPILASQKNIVVFSDVNAAETHTIEAFQLMLSANTRDSLDDMWYEKDTAFGLAEAVSRNTIWISNQSRSGMFDNVVSEYAELAQSTFWVGENSGLRKKDYDELILPLLDSVDFNQNNLIFIHLLGSHAQYKDRCPEQFQKFGKLDYPELLENQKGMVASYDNSILYNDYVVSEIMNYFTDSDAIILYFSDHGQDIYNTDPEYCGHAKDIIPESRQAALEVPFIVYTTDRFNELHGILYSRIKEGQDKSYDLENLMYTLADVMGIDTIGGDGIEMKTAFR